jgi:uncharacterized membrane protein
MLARIRLHLERARASLFFVPAVFVLAAVALAAAMLQVDAYLSRSGVDLPMLVQTTPESARSLLSAIASATITVAGVIFAITLVSIQLASSQFSPRVIPGFLRDSRQQRVMGLAVGTFAYSLVVLRAVRGSTDYASQFVPHVSSALSLVLAILTIVALVAFLDRSARTMQVGHIIHKLTEETSHRIRDVYPDDAGETGVAPASADVPAERGFQIRAMASGWVCHIDVDQILRLTPPNGVFRLDLRNGSFVAADQIIGEMWPQRRIPRLHGLRRDRPPRRRHAGPAVERADAPRPRVRRSAPRRSQRPLVQRLRQPRLRPDTPGGRSPIGHRCDVASDAWRTRRRSGSGRAG